MSRAEPRSRRFPTLEIHVAAPRTQGGGFPLEVCFDPAGQRQDFQGDDLPADLVQQVKAAGRLSAQGARLHQLLFANPALGRAWSASQAASPRRRVRLVIDPAAAELHTLPWESLTAADGAAMSVAANPRTPFSRYLPLELAPGDAVEERPLRLLVAIAAPCNGEQYDLASIDFELERASLQAALAPALATGTAICQVLPRPTTRAALARAVMQFQPHVVHLVAHGKQNPAPAPGVVYLEDEAGQVEPVEQARLLAVLENRSAELRLVVLASCESAGGRAGEAWQSLGLALVRQGLPAVIAMQGKVPMDAAREFASTFYERLFDHGVVDLAANEARALLLVDDPAGAAHPVVFSRLADGRLFAPAPAAAGSASGAICIACGPQLGKAGGEVRAFLGGRGFKTSTLRDRDRLDAERERELHQALTSCRALLLLADEAWPGAVAVRPEVAVARFLGKPVFVLWVGEGPAPAAVGGLVPLDLGRDRPAALAALEEQLFRFSVDARAATTWSGDRPPYPGLLAFEAADAPVYFGREEEIATGLERMQQMRRFGARRLLLVLGASGSGKSSLLRAGLLPRLGRDPERWLALAPFRPRSEPGKELASVLAEAFAQVGRTLRWEELAAELASPGAASALLGRLTDLRLAAGHRDATVVLAIDQLEEALNPAVNSRQTADAFLATLAELVATRDAPLLVVATLRSDFLNAFQESEAMEPVSFETLPIGPLSAAALAEVIEGPARLAGLEIEAGLTELLLREAGVEGGLPLLAFTLRELWERFGNDQLLEVAEYRDELGGLEHAIARVAEEILPRRFKGDEEEALRRAFLNLLRVDGRGLPSRHRVSWSSLPPAAHALLERFVEARLLVADGAGEGRTLEIAHEALCTSWKRLAGWLRENHEALMLRHDVEEAAARWQRGNESASRLLHGEEVRSALALAGEHGLALDTLSERFVSASEKATRWRRRFTRKRLAAAAVFLLLGLLVVAAVFGYYGVFAGQSLAQSAAFSPDGTHLAASGPSGEIRVWDLARPGDVRILDGADRIRKHVVVSADGKSLYSSGRFGGAIERFDVASGEIVARIDTESWLLGRLALSPDGRFLGASSLLHVWLWDIESGQLRAQFNDPKGTLPRGLGFTGNSASFAFGTSAGQVLGWVTATGKDIPALPLHAADLEAIAFARVNEVLVTVGLDPGGDHGNLERTLKIMDMPANQITNHLAGDAPAALAVAPDGSLLAFTRDGVVVVLDRETGQSFELSPEMPPLAIALEPGDLGTLAAVDLTGCVELWDLATRARKVRLEPGCEEVDWLTKLFMALPF